MAINVTGISREFIFHPGETLAEVLENKGVSQKELALRTGCSAAFINCVIGGKKDISAKFAIKLEYALGTPKSFWINLQAHYDEEIARFEEINNIQEEEKKVFRELSEACKYFKIETRNRRESDPGILISKLRECLRIGNLCYLKEFAGPCAFRRSIKEETNPYVLGAWVSIANNSTKIEEVKSSFNKKDIYLLVDSLKSIMLNSNGKCPVDEIRCVLSEHGIAFNIVKAFKKAPVQGYIGKRDDGAYQMVLTNRMKYADIFWFTLFHEIGHIYLNHVNQKNNLVDMEIGTDEAKENKADEFAKRAMINWKEYQLFVEKGFYSQESIVSFAEKNRVLPCVVLGRLQKEGRMKYSAFPELRVRYEL